MIISTLFGKDPTSNGQAFPFFSTVDIPTRVRHVCNAQILIIEWQHICIPMKPTGWNNDDDAAIHVSNQIV